MKTITLRNIDDELKKTLEAKAKASSTSLNTVVLTTLQHAFGLKKSPRKQRNHELEKLAGGWSEDDLSAFESATADFAQIDDDLWK